jgi:hypothetical protein
MIPISGLKTSTCALAVMSIQTFTARNAAHFARGQPGRRAARACPDPRLRALWLRRKVREQRGEAALLAGC